MESHLADMKAYGMMSEQQASDVLTARRLLWQHVDQIPPEYTGLVGATIEGTLVYASTPHGMITALDQANPTGRLGYFQPVSAIRNNSPIGNR